MPGVARGRSEGGFQISRLNCKAEGGGDNSLSAKRESPEVVDGAVPQDRRDPVRAGFPAAQSRGGQHHTHCHNAWGQCRPEQAIGDLWPVPSAGQTMASEVREGDEWVAYVALETFSTTGTRDGLPDASPRATESS